MDSAKIKKWIKEAHENAVERGFYDCPTCNGTGIDQNKNIGELLMLIVCEIGKAVEAHRCGRFCKWEYDFDFAKYLTRIVYTETMQLEFEDTNKDTFEDELADVFIRLFDLCGYGNIKLNYCEDHGIELTENVAESLYKIIRVMPNDTLNFGLLKNPLNTVFSALIDFCKNNKINIEKHIEAKMAYNRTREYKK